MFSIEKWRCRRPKNSWRGDTTYTHCCRVFVGGLCRWTLRKGPRWRVQRWSQERLEDRHEERRGLPQPIHMLRVPCVVSLLRFNLRQRAEQFLYVRHKIACLWCCLEQTKGATCSCMAWNAVLRYCLGKKRTSWNFFWWSQGLWNAVIVVRRGFVDMFSGAFDEMWFHSDTGTCSKSCPLDWTPILLSWKLKWHKMKFTLFLSFHFECDARRFARSFWVMWKKEEKNVQQGNIQN